VPVADIQLVDTSLRDGNQSLWGATGLTTAHILQIAPVMDRVGFRAMDFTSSTHMGISVRTHKENPWELIRLTHAAAPNTPLQFIGSGLRFISWEPVHPDLIQIAYDRLVEAGMSRFVVLDPMHDMQAVLRTARMLRRAGASEIIAALTYTISAVHDDGFYAGLAGQMAAGPDIDRVYIKDPAGLLTPERARTLIPAVRARLGECVPLELHSHCTIGLSPLTSASPRCTRRAGPWPTARRCRTLSAWSRTCASSGTPWTSTTGCWATSLSTSRGWEWLSPCRPGSPRSTTRRSCGTRSRAG
jgi:oxaloacetate decarboxylase (Na+ extruding) subunit alpha